MSTFSSDTIRSFRTKKEMREDLGSSYTVTYIAIELVNDPGKKFRVHTRTGYRPGRTL